MHLYINKNVLDWDKGLDSLDSGELDLRSYELWKHAESLLSQNPKRDYLADSIQSLNRAVRLRLNYLNSLYGLQKNPIKKYRADKLLFLTDTTIIRPKLLEEIYKIRNHIEHQDAKPPSLKECSNYLEFTWYFLKATDSMTKNIPSNILYKNVQNTKQWFKIEIDYSTWAFTASGIVSADLINDHNGSDLILSKFSIQKIGNLKKELGDNIDLLIQLIGNTPDNYNSINGDLKICDELVLRIITDMWQLY